MNRKHTFAAFVIAFAALSATALVADAQTWTAPTTAAPNGNTYAPLDTSATAQSKIAGLLISTNSSNTNGLIVQYGNVGIGATSPGYKLEVNGSIAVDSGGGFYYASDRRLKTDIQPLSSALDDVLKLQGVSFVWKSTGKKSVGLIAQDVEKVYPELVGTNPKTGMKAVEYGNLVAPLIEAVKAEQKEIDALKAEVAELKAAR